MPMFDLTYPEDALNAEGRAQAVERLTSALLRHEGAPAVRWAQPSEHTKRWSRRIRLRNSGFKYRPLIPAKQTSIRPGFNRNELDLRG
jgi:hypothetical protein